MSTLMANIPLKLIFYQDAHGDLYRGLQVVETAVAATTTLLGDMIEGVMILRFLISIVAAYV